MVEIKVNIKELWLWQKWAYKISKILNVKMTLTYLGETDKFGNHLCLIKIGEKNETK